MQPDGCACYFLNVRETSLVWLGGIDGKMVAHPSRVRSARYAAQSDQKEIERKFLCQRFCLGHFCGVARAPQYSRGENAGDVKNMRRPQERFFERQPNRMNEQLG
jgi:hypothetical protein